jgi:hypothetical protein
MTMHQGNREANSFLTGLFLDLVQVFVVRQDLKMGSGKIASQCARKASFLLLIPNPKS